MSLQLEKTFPRLWSVKSGIVMVVTDLHGEGDVYLCLARGCHAIPPDAGEYLLFDAQTPVKGFSDLLKCLHSVYE